MFSYTPILSSSLRLHKNLSTAQFRGGSFNCRNIPCRSLTNTNWYSFNQKTIPVVFGSNWSPVKSLSMNVSPLYLAALLHKRVNFSGRSSFLSLSYFSSTLKALWKFKDATNLTPDSFPTDRHWYKLSTLLVSTDKSFCVFNSVNAIGSFCASTSIPRRHHPPPPLLNFLLLFPFNCGSGFIFYTFGLQFKKLSGKRDEGTEICFSCEDLNLVSRSSAPWPFLLRLEDTYRSSVRCIRLKNF